MRIKEKRGRAENKKIVVLVAPWGLPLFFYRRVLGKIPNNFGFLAYNCPRPLLSADITATRRHFFELVNKMKQDMKELNDQSPREFYLYAQSFGCAVCAALVDEFEVKRVSFVVPGSNLANAVWRGKRTRRMTASMKESGITFSQLKKEWREMSPDYYIQRGVGEIEYLVRLTKRDKMVPYNNGCRLLTIMKNSGIRYVLKENALLTHRGVCTIECLFPHDIDFLFETS